MAREVNRYAVGRPVFQGGDNAFAGSHVMLRVLNNFPRRGGTRKQQPVLPGVFGRTEAEQKNA
jgi:hypothetical protein